MIKKLGRWLGNSLHASLAEMLSFCLKAWALEGCLPSLGWVKTISFSMIAAELKWRIIYLNFWSMKPNAASVYCVCLRDHKSGEEFTKRWASGLIPTFSWKWHRMWGGSTSLRTAPPHPLAIQKAIFPAPYFLPLPNPITSSFLTEICFKLFHCWRLMKSSCITYQQPVLLPRMVGLAAFAIYPQSQPYWQPRTTPWVSQIPSHQHLIGPVSVTHASNPGVATCNQTSCTRASRQGLSKAAWTQVQVAKTDVEGEV